MAVGAISTALMGTGFATVHAQASSTRQPGPTSYLPGKGSNQEFISLSCPQIQSGLKLRLAGHKVVVSAGACWLNDALVKVPEETTLMVPAVLNQQVHDEPAHLTETALAGISAKAILIECRARQIDPVPIAGLLVPGSLRVKSAPGNDGVLYKAGVDYLIDPNWGALARVESGSIKEHKSVYVDYQCFYRRLDTLVLDGAGTIRLILGTPAKSAPEPPKLREGLLPLANIYTGRGVEALTPANVLPIVSVQAPELPVSRSERNRKALSRTLQKLQNGEPVKIVFWGDSVTAGADASNKAVSWSSLVLSRLRKKYPKAQLAAVNAGIGGTNTNHRLPKISKEVLSYNPDLIVLEFVNDLMVPISDLEHNYEQIMAKTKQTGADLLLCAPHFPIPSLVGVKDWKAVAANPYIELVRRLAGSNDVALADVSQRWEHLDKEGLRPELLLVDEVIHPNDRGHAIYAEEVMKCFH